jgi:hypothetical protein
MARAFAGFASPRFRRCLRPVFAARTIWKWNQKAGRREPAGRFFDGSPQGGFI